jgi:hypothetical protein
LAFGKSHEAEQLKRADAFGLSGEHRQAMLRRLRTARADRIAPPVPRRRVRLATCQFRSPDRCDGGHEGASTLTGASPCRHRASN